MALPLTRIEPPTPEQWAAMVAGGRSAEIYDWVIASSTNAADAIARAVAEGGGRLSGNVLAVGPATRDALAAHGIRSVVPARADAIGAAEHVLAAGTHAVWWPRAEAGREEGRDLLRARGVRVDDPVAYRTVAATAADPAVRAGLAALRRARVVCFYAPSQVAALADLVDLAVLARAAVLAIGETTAAALAERGVRVDAVPTSPDPEAMASAIVAVYPGVP